MAHLHGVDAEVIELHAASGSEIAGKPLKKLAKNFHQNNGAKILPFAGFNMPINYKTGIINEHKNVRNHKV